MLKSLVFSLFLMFSLSIYSVDPVYPMGMCFPECFFEQIKRLFPISKDLVVADANARLPYKLAEMEHIRIEQALSDCKKFGNDCSQLESDCDKARRTRYESLDDYYNSNERGELQRAVNFQGVKVDSVLFVTSVALIFGARCLYDWYSTRKKN